MSFNNPSWVAPIESTFDEGQPIRSGQGFMLAGNPIAIAQGAAGAPKIADKTVAGAGTVTISGLNDFGGLWVRGHSVKETVTSGAVTLGDVSVEISTDNGASFLASETIVNINVVSSDPGNAFMNFESFIDFSSGGHKSILSGLTGSGEADSTYASGSITGLDNAVTDIRISGLSVLFATPQGGESAS